MIAELSIKGFYCFRQERHSSATVDELTSSKWTVLLRRVSE